MEKNQHNDTKPGQPFNGDVLAQPAGQQLPTGENREKLDRPVQTEKTVRHSDSSFPTEDGETTGTP